MEIELKLSLEPGAADKLRRLALLRRHAGAKPSRSELLAIYYDTPDFHLMRHGAGLRVRADRGAWTQTLKAGGSVLAGLHQRHEWECALGDEHADLAALRAVMHEAPGWAAVLAAPALQERLQALFTVRVRRSTWLLHVDEAEIELVLDEGTLEACGQTQPICEIELELLSGQPGQLYDFALQLLHHLPLRLDNRNKAERGYALCLPESGAPAPATARPLTLQRQASVGEGLQAILGNCIAHIQDNEAGVLDGRDPECLHQMRVGLRRLRSALKLFTPVAPCPPELLAELDWLGAALGAARDWDVMATSTLALLPANAKPAAPLPEMVAAMRARQQRRVADALQSPRYTGLLLAFCAWLPDAGHEGEVVLASLDQTLAGFADATLRAARRRLRKRGRRIAEADAHTLHRLRIAVKKARYAAQFFASLYRAKPGKAYAAALGALQDELGWRNDIDVADRLLQQLPQEGAEQTAAVAFARGFLLARLTSQPDQLRRAWRALRDLPLPPAA